MTDYLAATMAMLGPAQNRYAQPSAWERLHADLGIRLPPDYRVIVDAYAPIQLNGHLYLPHPATEKPGPVDPGHHPRVVRSALG